MANKQNGQEQAVNQLADLSQLSVADIEQLLKNKKAEQSRIAAEKGVEARKDVEAYCLKKHGLTLAQIWMAGWFGEPKTYRNPKTNETYSYSGRGKVPERLKGADGKPRADLIVN